MSDDVTRHDDSSLGTSATDVGGAVGSRTGAGSAHGTGTGTDTTSGPRTVAPSRSEQAGAASAGAHGDGRLLPSEECDKFTLRLQHAVSGFVDAPRESVQEADHVLEELAGRFTEAITQRRRTLRMSWQDRDGGAEKSATSTDTEQLRLALRDYRELAERLLHG
ncbi:hypothetical protein ACYF6T_37600 [Streptomyces sp. 7R007]